MHYVPFPTEFYLSLYFRYTILFIRFFSLLFGKSIQKKYEEEIQNNNTSSVKVDWRHFSNLYLGKPTSVYYLICAVEMWTACEKCSQYTDSTSRVCGGATYYYFRGEKVCKVLCDYYSHGTMISYWLCVYYGLCVLVSSW